jgi:hypothetical protein
VAPLFACPLGDLQAAAQIVITETPPDCCYGEWAGSLTGTVTNVDSDSAVVVLYARTDRYYIQPYEGSLLELDCAGTFFAPTHGGTRYCALLVRRAWQPPSVLADLPPVGGPVLAVACAPDEQRRIEFAGRTWIVKSTGGVPFGPGPNSWSDASDNVWVDALGQLHLRITQRDGRWQCAEVFTQSYVGYGSYRFEVEGAIDALPPEVVFAGFFYSDQGDEADIEFSRWGDPQRASNAQFVVQPDAVHPLEMQLTKPTSTHEIRWQPGRIDFTSWDGECRVAPAPAASWSYTGDVPSPDLERMRFNLWLFQGAAPQREVEVVVRAFAEHTPTDVATRVASQLELVAPRIVTEQLDYELSLAQAGAVRLRLFDPRGRVVGRLLEAELSAGVHRGSWQGVRLARGVYFLQLESAQARRTARVLLLR